MKPVSYKKTRIISALVLTATILSSCGKVTEYPHDSDSSKKTAEANSPVTSGGETSSECPRWENPISFDGLDVFTHNDEKLFLDYKDDERKIYPFDDFSHITVQRMHYFDTRSGVGIPDDDGATKSAVGITEEGGKYKILWTFTAQNGNAVPKLSIDTHNYHIFSKITFEVTNRSDKPISFGILTSEFNAQPETNPKAGTFSAYSKPVRAGESRTVSIDFSKIFANYELLPLATGGLTLSAIGAAKDTEYEILLSDFTFVWAENELLTDAAVGVKEAYAEANAGITIAVAARGLTKEQDVAVEFHKDGSLFTWRVRLSDEEKATLIRNGIIGLETSVPWWADTGEYEAILAVDSYRVTGAYSDTISITNGGKYTLPESEVKTGADGIPAIWINGSKFDWNGIASAAYGPGMAYEFGEQNSSVYIIESCAGAHNYPANCYPTLIAPGINDFSQLEEYCNFTMQANRNAYILLRVNFCLPDFWAKANPDDVALGTADGKTFVRSEESSGMTNLSLASRKWVEEEKRQIKALMDYVKSQPWCSRVIGCMLTGGVTEEWFAFFHNTDGMWGDFSKVNADAFLEWGKSRSITDGLPSLHIPLPSERVNKSFIIKPESDASRLAAAYTQYINELCVSVIGEFADALKVESENRMLCGALYGYLIEFSTANSPTEAGSLTLKQYLAQKSIDFMCGIPLLDWRDPTNGYDIGVSLTRSIQAAGKIYIQENDTWLSTYTKRVYPSSRPDDNMDGNLDMLESTFAYFRATAEQDVAGIDVVLHQILPGFTDAVHTMPVCGKLGDPEFFEYLLGKLCISQAQLTEHMKGRAMCEIFGAYGWAEGVPTMKQIADSMLVNGINRFVPHAFDTIYPNPDCPPHFYIGGRNPQFVGFIQLMQYMQRASHLLDGGIHNADIALFYNAEGEWNGGKNMLTQHPAKLLTRAHADFEIVWEDLLYSGHAENGYAVLGGKIFRLILVPYAEILPEKLLRALNRYAENSVPVLFIGEKPEQTSEGGDADKLICACGKLAEDSLAEYVKEKRLCGIITDEEHPLLRYYSYSTVDGRVWMVKNDDIFCEADFFADLGEHKELRIYDCWSNRLYLPEMQGNRIRIRLSKGGSCFIVESSETAAPMLYPNDSGKRVHLNATVSVCPVGKDVFTPVPGYPRDITSIKGYESFCGRIRYEGSFDSDGANDLISLGRIGEIATAWLNGIELGISVSDPCLFTIYGVEKVGVNRLTIEIINNPAYRDRDFFSTYMTLPASGFGGEITLFKRDHGGKL